ncbi:unnamed protein product [Closterium sp. Naga37s-1]|nr:unnamed protein product [Closterium sp. Naga37s-1]
MAAALQASRAVQRVSPRSPAPARRLLLLLLLVALLLLVRGSRGGAGRGEERREGKAEEKEDDEEEEARRATIGLLAHGWNDVREWRAGLVKGVEYVKIDFSWMPPARCKLQVRPPSQMRPAGGTRGEGRGRKGDSSPVLLPALSLPSPPTSILAPPTFRTLIASSLLSPFSPYRTPFSPYRTPFSPYRTPFSPYLTPSPSLHPFFSPPSSAFACITGGAAMAVQSTWLLRIGALADLCPKNRPLLCTTNHTRAAMSAHVASHDMPRGDVAEEKAIRMHHVVPRGSSSRVLRVMARGTDLSSKNSTTNAGASGASGTGVSETGASETGASGASAASGARRGGDGIRWGDEAVRQWMRLFDDFFLRANAALHELHLSVEFFLNDMGGKCVAQRWRPWVIAWDDNDLTSRPATTNDPRDASDRFQVLNHDATFTWWAAAAQQQFMKFKDSPYALVLYEPQDERAFSMFSDVYLSANLTHTPGFRFASNIDPIMFRLFTAPSSHLATHTPYADDVSSPPPPFSRPAVAVIPLPANTTRYSMARDPTSSSTSTSSSSSNPPSPPSFAILTIHWLPGSPLSPPSSPVYTVQIAPSLPATHPPETIISSTALPGGELLSACEVEREKGGRPNGKGKGETQTEQVASEQVGSGRVASVSVLDLPHGMELEVGNGTFGGGVGGGRDGGGGGDETGEGRGSRDRRRVGVDGVVLVASDACGGHILLWFAYNSLALSLISRIDLAERMPQQAGSSKQLSSVAWSTVALERPASNEDGEMSGKHQQQQQGKSPKHGEDEGRGVDGSEVVMVGVEAYIPSENHLFNDSTAASGGDGQRADEEASRHSKGRRERGSREVQSCGLMGRLLLCSLPPLPAHHASNSPVDNHHTSAFSTACASVGRPFCLCLPTLSLLHATQQLAKLSKEDDKAESVAVAAGVRVGVEEASPEAVAVAVAEADSDPPEPPSRFEVVVTPPPHANPMPFARGSMPAVGMALVAGKRVAGEERERGKEREAGEARVLLLHTDAFCWNSFARHDTPLGSPQVCDLPRTIFGASQPGILAYTYGRLSTLHSRLSAAHASSISSPSTTTTNSPPSNAMVASACDSALLHGTYDQGVGAPAAALLLLPRASTRTHHTGERTGAEREEGEEEQGEERREEGKEGEEEGGVVAVAVAVHKGLARGGLNNCGDPLPAPGLVLDVWDMPPLLD